MRPAPALPVWIAAAALAAAVIGAALLRHDGAAYDLVRQQAIAAFAAQALAAPRRPGELRVLGLGTSLLWAATPPGQFDPQRRHPRLHWMRLVKSGMGMGELTQSLAPIEHAPPDILVIEKGLLFVEEDKSRNRQAQIDVKRMLKGALFEAQDPGPLAAQLAGLPCEQQQTELDAARSRAHAIAVRRGYAQPGPDPALVALLRRLSLRGVRIMVLDVPRQAQLEQASAADKARWVARLRQALPPGRKLSYHSAPSHPHSALYCEGSHLNAAGSRLFGAWWLAELAAVAQAER
jgi:hypothetical protein